MAEPIQIDSRGMKCPRPVIELAKARRQADPGAIIVIQADDLAFESDVRACVRPPAMCSSTCPAKGTP